MQLVLYPLCLREGLVQGIFVVFWALGGFLMQFRIVVGQRRRPAEGCALAG